MAYINRLVFITLFVVNCIVCFAQEANNFPVDTSFTLHSAYQKEVKKYPFIKPVYPVVPESVSVKRDLVYACHNGHDMHIDIYSPHKMDKPAPAVVLVHGGGWISGNKKMEAPLAIYLAQQGFVAATVEYRLSPEALYPAAVFDIKTAIRWLRKNAPELNINPEKIAVSGTSAGGQLAALIGATNGSGMYIDSTRYMDYSSKVQAVIDIDGVLAFIHPESGEGADKPGKPSAATRWFGENKHQKKERWVEASALTHVSATMPPTLFINSQHARFHAGRDDVIAILDSLGIYSEVLTIPDTPHPFWLFDPWFEQTAQWCHIFLNKQFNDE
ncbi:MAG: alpha/beta hydrolase [Prolixibacteraceae bacterium]|nr:alpha/beta hydrolase [Prolixibacteraceae bacterium]